MACGIAKMIVVAVMVADIVAPRTVEIKLPATTTAAVIETTQPQHTQSVESVESVETTVFESETTVFVENWQKTEEYVPQTAPSWQDGFVHYRIAGVKPPYEWQWYLYGKLADRGLEWFYPYAVCQIYQESNWNQYSTNGRDHGLTQQKGMYWPERSAQAGIPSADIWDVNAQIHVYVWQMAQYLAAAGYDTGRALSMYYTGADVWSEEYVNHVMRWLDYLEVVP